MKANDLIDILNRFKDCEIEFIYSEYNKKIEIWTSGGEDLVGEFDAVKDV